MDKLKNLWRLLLFFCVFSSDLWPIEFSTSSEINEILAAHAIKINVHFGAEDKLLYRESLRFSTDNLNLRLKMWRPLQEPAVEYVPAFKNNKKVFTCSFDLNLQFEFLTADQVEQRTCLSESKIFIGYVVLTKLGKNEAHVATVILPAARDGLTKKDAVVTHTAQADYARDLDVSARLTRRDHAGGGRHEVFEQLDNAWDLLASSWRQLMMLPVVWQLSFFWLLLTILMLLLAWLGRLPRRLVNHVEKPLPQLLVFISCLSFLRLASDVLPDRFFYTILLVIALGFGFHFLKITKPLPETFLVKFCRLLAFALLLLVIPVLLKILVE